MSTVRVRVRAPSLAAKRLWLDKVENRLKDRSQALLKATNAVASIWEKNFQSEGGSVGGWAQLADATIERRSQQGFAPGPILIRYGALHSVVTEGFMQARGPSSWSRTDSYSPHNTTARLSISKELAVLEAHGWKIANQYGHPNRSGSRIPARPFWFVDRQVTAAARGATEEWIKNEVVKP